MELRADSPLARLALAEVQAMGGKVNDCESTLYNLVVAEELGQLHRDIEGEICTGFCAWVRLTFDQLVEAVEHRVRIFRVTDNVPGAPVLFVTEQANFGSPRKLYERRHFLAAQSGVRMLSGWRNDKMLKLRVHATRGH